MLQVKICGNGLEADLQLPVRQLQAMSSKKQRYRLTDAVMDWCLAWGRQHSSLNAIQKPKHAVFNRLLNFLEPVQLILLSTVHALMSITLQKPSIPLLAQWSNNGGSTVTKWRLIQSSFLMRPILPLVAVLLNQKCEPCVKHLEKVQIAWLLPIRKDSLVIQWVLGSKTRVCSMA